MRISIIVILTGFFLIWAELGKANPDLGQGGPSPGAVLAAPGAGIVGDVNGDGQRNILDLLRLLKHFSEGLSYLESADLDKNSEVDVYDLIILLNLLAPWHERQEKFEFAIIFQGWGCQLLGDKCMMTIWTDQGCQWGSMVIPQKRAYWIYSNKQVVQTSFVFGDDTLTTLEGQIGPDFEPVPLDTAYIGHDSEININVPWRVHLEAADGSTVDSVGSTEFELLVCVIIDGSVPIIGREIEFPLVLDGPLQRFLIIYPEDSMIVDINPEQADCVIFPDIDSLVTAIRTGSQESISYIDLGQAVEIKSGKKTNRLLFELQSWGGIGVGSLDGNEELMDKLGFPSWLPREDGYYDLGYR